MLLLFFLVFFISEKYIQYHKLHIRRLILKTIHGVFINRAEHLRYQFTQIGNTNTFNFHCHGTSNSADELIVFQPETDRYIISENSYAILLDPILKIYEDDKITELIRLENETVPTYIVPTIENVETEYEFVQIIEDDLDEFDQQIHEKLIDATFNDWCLYKGPENYLAKGIFIMDKNKVCFFYIPIDTIHKLESIKKEIQVRKIGIEEMKNLFFMGCLA